MYFIIASYKALRFWASIIRANVSLYRSSHSNPFALFDLKDELFAVIVHPPYLRFNPGTCASLGAFRGVQLKFATARVSLYTGIGVSMICVVSIGVVFAAIRPRAGAGKDGLEERAEGGD